MIPKPPSDLADALRLHQAGRLDAARTLYQRALDADPGAPAALHGLGLIALDLGRPDEALPLLTRCSAAAPGDALYRTSLGLALLASGNAKQAAAHLLETANGAPHLAEPRVHLARALGALGRPQQALEMLTDAVAHFPDRADLWALKGNTERTLGHRDHAEASLRTAVDLNPDDAAAAHGLALLLTAAERPADAIPLYRRVLGATPDNGDALTNLGVALLATGDVARAEDSYRRAIALAPDSAEAHYNLAWLLLLTGRWAEGWEHYEWRWRLTHFSSRIRGFRDVVWDGSPISGTLLVHAEQGLGDTIQFARFLAAAKARCGRVQFECPRPLARLFRTLAPALADAIVAVGEPVAPFDRHLPLMSLGRLFAPTPESVRLPPYLSSPSVIPLRLRLPRNGHKKVGLVWAGSPDNKIDRRRSLPAALLAPLTAVAGVDFVSLQVGPQADQVRELQRGDVGQIVFDCHGTVDDFADTAAVIHQLDLVIGVDTAAIHLAAALGKPTWLMLPFMPDYRWLLGRSDSPWYESIRLFRQDKPGDWANVVAKLSAALTEWKGANG